MGFFIAALVYSIIIQLATASIQKKNSRLIGTHQDELGIYETIKAVYGQGGLPAQFNYFHKNDAENFLETTLSPSTNAIAALLNKRDACISGYKLCPSFSKCCPERSKCCNYGYCVTDNAVCCPQRACPQGTTCCGKRNCVAPGGDCCQDGSSCGPGNKCFQKISRGPGSLCCTNSECTAHVENGETIYATTSTTTSASTSTSVISVTGQVEAKPTIGDDGSSDGITKSKPTAEATKTGSIGGGDAAGNGAKPDEQDNKSGGVNIGAIVGGTLGGVSGLAAIIGLVIFVLRGKKQTRAGKHSTNGSPSPFLPDEKYRSSPSTGANSDQRPSAPSSLPVLGSVSPATNRASQQPSYLMYSPSPLSGAHSPGGGQWPSSSTAGDSTGHDAAQANALLCPPHHTQQRASRGPEGPVGTLHTDIIEAPTPLSHVQLGEVHELA